MEFGALPIDSLGREEKSKMGAKRGCGNRIVRGGFVRMITEWLYRVDEDCQTPLSRAAQTSHMALTELLLRQEAEDRAQSLEGSSLLHKASSLGLDEATELLLSGKSDPNEFDKYGETPLHKAARHGHLHIAELLLRQGANPNVRNVFGLTPLHWIALNGRADIGELLLNSGADPFVADDYLDGLTPINLAEIMGYRQLAAMFVKHCS
jgi:cytohesin